MVAKKEIQVVAGVFISGRKISLFKRSQNESWAGFWEFPGGKIEELESPTQALVRELKEELAVDAKPIYDFGWNTHEYEHVIVHLNLHLVEAQSLDFTLVDHSEWSFFSFEEIKGLNLSAADVPFLDRISSRLR